MKSLIGKKVGMTQLFAEDGTAYPVTVVEVSPNVITAIKTVEKDGYSAVQIGFGDIKEKRLNKPQLGQFKKANVAAKASLHELELSEIGALQVGEALTVNQFKPGDIVDVIGVSKGKGYSGAIKRWHFKIGPKGHGASGPHRSQGSMATVGRTNNRVHPGKKMAGHHGNKQTTVLNLLVVGVDEARNALLIRGGLPGPNKGLLKIRSAIKVQLGQVQVAKPLISRLTKPAAEEAEVK
jgi:large subunit ribosomal protein L3